MTARRALQGIAIASGIGYAIGIMIGDGPLGMGAFIGLTFGFLAGCILTVLDSARGDTKPAGPGVGAAAGPQAPIAGGDAVPSAPSAPPPAVAVAAFKPTKGKFFVALAFATIFGALNATDPSPNKSALLPFLAALGVFGVLRNAPAWKRS